MLKNLTILALAGALLPACIITTDDTTTSASATVSEGTTDDTAGTTGGTTGGTTDGSDSATTGGATDSGTTATPPTTGEPTTGEPTTGEVTTGGTTGQGSEYGMCGWVAAANYYGCVDPDGAEPGVEDPAGIDPIACPDGLVEGDPCTDMEGPIDNIGCCAPNGDLFLCDSQGGTNTIIKVACGA